MKRNYEEVLTYNVFGPVKVTYEFAGDINDADFRGFKSDYLNKAETKDYKLNCCPRKFREQVEETIREMGVDNGC